MAHTTDLGGASMEAAFRRISQKAGRYESPVAELLEDLPAKEGVTRHAAVARLAKEHIRECEHYRQHLHSFSADELDAFVWMVVMQLDLVRQLVPGFVNCGIPELNEMLEEYEGSLMREIELRYDE